MRWFVLVSVLVAVAAAADMTSGVCEFTNIMYGASAQNSCGTGMVSTFCARRMDCVSIACTYVLHTTVMTFDPCSASLTLSGYDKAGNVASGTYPIDGYSLGLVDGTEKLSLVSSDAASVTVQVGVWPTEQVFGAPQCIWSQAYCYRWYILAGLCVLLLLLVGGIVCCCCSCCRASSSRTVVMVPMTNPADTLKQPLLYQSDTVDV